MNQKKTAVLILVVCLWMLFIFSFSAQPDGQTNQLSLRVTQKMIDLKILALPDTMAPQSYLLLANRYIRKVAHFSLFMVLGFIVSQGIRLRVKNPVLVFVFALLLCCIYAISDEWHQMFVPGRNAEWTDVLIDSAGAFLGILLSSMWSRIRAKREK